MPRRDGDDQDDWDDTQLVKVWEECLAEYKKYHSIAVNGGTEQDIELLVAEQQAADEEEYQPEDEQAELEMNAATVIDEVKSATIEGQDGHQHRPEVSDTVLETPKTSMQPPPLPTNMQESMKALALSWYYAGYYAGVADAESRAQQNVSG